MRLAYGVVAGGHICGEKVVQRLAGAIIWVIPAGGSQGHLGGAHKSHTALLHHGLADVQIISIGIAAGIGEDDGRIIVVEIRAGAVGGESLAGAVVDMA